jgi:hypothetical protein
MENPELLSLYDYLGKAAGAQLGAEVNALAQAKQIKYAIREVSNSKYIGKVMLYPKSFLDEYFKTSQIDDLPF